jgi:hypothetical protein
MISPKVVFVFDWLVNYNIGGGEKVLAAYRSQKPAGKGVLRTVYAVSPDGKIIFGERGQASYNEIIEVIKKLT